MEEGNCGLVRLELRNAARTGCQVPLELRVHLRRQVVFHEIRQQTHEIGAAAFFWHGSSLQSQAADYALEITQEKESPV